MAASTSPASIPEFALEAYGLEKTYPGSKKREAKHALKGVDLKVKTGSIFGLLGPNGAGKSTLLKTVTGELHPLNGESKLGAQVEIGYFAQAHEGLDPKKRVLDVVMEDGTSIRLPEINPEEAWARLADYQEEHKLFEKKLASVDMRVPNRILVKIDNLERIRKPLMGQDT